MKEIIIRKKASNPEDVQTQFLNSLRGKKISLCLEGSNLAVNGILKAFDKYSILMDIEGKETLFFKHAVQSLRKEG